MSDAITRLQDPLPLAQALIRCASVTPADAGALDVLSEALAQLGFGVERMAFQIEEPRVDNLYARLGTSRPHLAFAGHSDVVPEGKAEDWAAPPFAAEIRGGMLYGRGAADMKGAIAAFVAATARFLDAEPELAGSLSLLITGDEEGPAVNGTRPMVAMLADRGEAPDHCLVGEPTNPESLGDMIKVGRRGSLNAWVTVRGLQGHVAYPDQAKNPVPILIDLLRALSARPLDQGTERFQPSNLEVTDLHVGNPATNVIPAEATGRFNIRFNTEHSGASLTQWIEETAAQMSAARGVAIDLQIEVSGEAFLNESPDFTRLLTGAVEKVTGRVPVLSTTGGTSDARFIKDICPVAEFGLISRTMHKVDEQIAIADLERLTEIYLAVLTAYFGRHG